jgi:hypothetical protein
MPSPQACSGRGATGGGPRWDPHERVPGPPPPSAGQDDSSPLPEHAPMLRSVTTNPPRGRDVVRSWVMTDATDP